MSLLRRRPAPPPLLCRWDLDKTYLRSEFDTLRQLWRTVRERGEDKVEVPGVPEVLKGLKAAASRAGRPIGIHFVSASPPQIGKAIRDKLALDGVPYDGIVFKDQLQHLTRGQFTRLREHVGFKLRELLAGRLAVPPETRELLFGDDWESDPLTYSLYADVLAGTLAPDDLGPILARLGVAPAPTLAVVGLAREAQGRGGVERIFINLERRTPPAVFRLLGARLVPTFNYFQTAVVLAADGWLEVEDVAAVARALVARSGYTPRRLENSLADCVRRGVLESAAARRLALPLRDAGLLPPVPGPRWMEWVRTHLPRTRPRTRAAAPLDWDAVLARLRPPRVPVAAEARP